MTIEEIKTHLEACGLHDRVKEFDESSATVELAAHAVGCEPCRIAKTMSFLVDGGVALIVLGALSLPKRGGEQGQQILDTLAG